MTTQPQQQPYASASLYVGDLAEDVTEGQLFDLFKNVGPVASIRVCRDAVTRRSLGYAYVNFHNAADAERAIEQYNFQPVNGKQCRIMWSQRDPAKRKSGTGNIFIKNLDKSITNASLYDTFSAFGHILSCKVEVDHNGVSKGFGYVAYQTQEEADQAVAKVNGMMIADKIVFVGPFQPKKARGADNTSSFTNVYVKNLPPSVSNEQLAEIFGAYGKVTSCAVITNETNQSKQFGFVNYENHEEAQKAIDNLHDSLVDGRRVFVGRAQKRSERDEVLRQQRAEQMQKFQGTNVYVKNLDDNIDDEKLKQEFSRFGTIQSAKVMTDDKGNSRGFGFVWYNSPEDASRAIAEMNGVIFGSKPLYASIAQRKDVRRAQLVALHQQKANMMHMNPMGMMNVPRGGPGMGFPPGGPGFFPPQQMGGMPRMPYPPQMIPRQRAFTPGQANGQPNGVQVPRGNQGPPHGAPNGANVGQRVPNRPRNAPTVNQNGGGRGGRPQNAQGQINKSFKYTSTARNQPEPEVANANPEAMKQAAGELLFSQIVKSQPVLAGKITGMLLAAHEVNELFEIAHAPARLDSLITEAVTLLEESNEPAPAATTAVPVSVPQV